MQAPAGDGRAMVMARKMLGVESDPVAVAGDEKSVSHNRYHYLSLAGTHVNRCWQPQAEPEGLRLVGAGGGWCWP